MDFTTAEQERERLRSQHAAGQITGDGYAAAVSALRVTDSSGRWWQPDPSGPGWLVWNGSAWVPGVPPGKSGLQPGTPKNFVEFQSRLMTVDEFKKMSKEVPLAKRPQKWWDLLSILGGCASAVLWLLYSGIREGFDFLTPVLMIAIPVFMIWFREDLDVALLGFQPYRKDVNKLLLVGIGMAFPFLTAFVLYNIFHITQYSLIQTNMIVGTFGAYIITRNPVISVAGMGGQPGSGQRPVPANHGILILFATAICYFLCLPVRADDCTRDVLNAQDCLRTGGYAEVISGGFSTILSTSVNGPTVVQTLSGGGTQAPQPPTQPATPSTPATPGTPADQAGQAVPSTGQPAAPADQAGSAGQAAGTSQTGQPSVPADQAGTGGQATGQSATAPSTQPASPADQAGSAGQSAGPSQTTTPSTGQPATPADQAGSAAQSAGQQQGPATTSQPATAAGQAGTAAPAGTQQGPDGLPFNPDDVQNIKEAIDDIRKEKELAAAAAAAAVTAAAGAGAAAATLQPPTPPTPPGIDPNTGKRILTPEQQARREQILKEMAASQAEAEAWSSYADKLDTAVTVLETVEKTADIAIDVGSTLSPGAGGRIKNIYAATKTITKNMSEGYATDKGLWEGFKKGAVEAATDKALDVFAGQVTDKFGGKIPGFGKFESPADDLGDMSLSAIRDRLKKPVDTGDIVQDIRGAITHNQTEQAVKNAVKNAVQGQVQSASLWDPFKKFFGVSS